MTHKGWCVVKNQTNKTNKQIQFKIVLLLFGAAYAAPNKGPTNLYSFSKIYISSNAV